LTGDELGDVGMLLELQIGAEVSGWGWESELDMCAAWVGDLEVHVTLDIH